MSATTSWRCIDVTVTLFKAMHVPILEYIQNMHSCNVYVFNLFIPGTMTVLIWFLCFRFDALTELGAFMRTEFLCISVLRVASGPRVKLASCKSALNPPVVCSTDRSKAVVPVLVLLFVALWFILRGNLLYVFPCVILFLGFSVLLVLRLPRLGKRELILVLFVRL